MEKERIIMAVAAVMLTLTTGCGNMANQERLVLDQLQQAQTTQSLYDGGNVAIGKGQYLQNFGIYANVVEVCTDGVLHLGVTLADNANQTFGLLCAQSEWAKQRQETTPGCERPDWEASLAFSDLSGRCNRLQRRQSSRTTCSYYPYTL